MQLKPAFPLPAALTEIRTQADEFTGHARERMLAAQRWARQAEHLRHATRNTVVEYGGATIRLGELSPGCCACKAGRWDCVFLSMACNLSCAFCLTPAGYENASRLSALGSDLDSLCRRYISADVIGIGFSGGEPMLRPRRLLDCITTLRSRLPHLYFWAYTNGLPLTTDLISDLAEAGLHELRFNMAATGYINPHVNAMLRHAVARLPAVTVEIPAVPEHATALREALTAWSSGGVKYLNLHELIYEPGSPSASMPGAREFCRMPDGHVCEFNPLSSELVAQVLRAVEAGGLTLAINYCSLASKARQLQGRRRMLAAYTLRAHERLCMDGLAESICRFSATRCEFVHPAGYSDFDQRFTRHDAALVRRLLPLALDGPGQWTHFELLQAAEA